MSTNLIQWLLEGPAYVQYHTRLDLLRQSPQDPAVQAARVHMLADPALQMLLAELCEWPKQILTSHKVAGHPLHKLVFIADLGLTLADEPIRQIAARVMQSPAENGPFQVLMNIPVHYGGTGQDQWAWALCDSPSLLYALLKFGLGDDERVQKAQGYLANLVRENGWGCGGGMGKFRGPGRKEDPCPYANLIMLKALALSPEWRESPAARAGAESALHCWETRREQHPYMFYMGTDFEKLKAPLVWYDLLHVLDVLTQFPFINRDPRLEEMLSILRGKADADGRFTPESAWQAWKDWEFGQKKQPSRWLTLLAQRVMLRTKTSQDH